MPPSHSPDDGPMVEAPIDVSHVLALAETYGPVKVTVLGLPLQARLTAGRLNPDGSWTVGWGELAGLAIRAPRDLPEFDMELVPELDEDAVPEAAAPAQAAQPADPPGQDAAAADDDGPPPQAGAHRSWTEAEPAGAKRPAPSAPARTGASWVDFLDG